MMTDDSLVYEEDSLTVRSSHLSLRDQGHQNHQCAHQCVLRPGLPRDPESSQATAMQTVRNADPTPMPTLARDSRDLVLVPREHLAAMQRYYLAVKEAYCNYSLSDGDSDSVLRKLFERTPEVLCSADKQGRSPIESALAQGRWAAGERLIELAGRRNPRALLHRAPSGEDALMLAVSGGNEAAVRRLVALDCGAGACFRYNAQGRNALHLCALGPSDRALEVLLGDLADRVSRGQLTPDCVAAALITGDRDGCTPLHHMARNDRAGMLEAVRDFAGRCRLPSLDWDARQTAGDLRLTPLAAAAEADALAACDLLLRRGLAGVDLHDHRDIWLQVELSDSARALLAQHCPLLEPMTPQSLARLQAGLQERRLTDEFLLRLREHWPDMPQLPQLATVLAVFNGNFPGSCRLVVWDILTGMGVPDLAGLLEAR